VLRFEKAVSANVQMRTKFADKPDKCVVVSFYSCSNCAAFASYHRFMESEVELDEAISGLKAYALRFSI
jgi:hypothetical protein